MDKMEKVREAKLCACGQSTYNKDGICDDCKEQLKEHYREST